MATETPTGFEKASSQTFPGGADATNPPLGGASEPLLLHRLRIEKALVTASHMLIASGVADLEQALGLIGEAVGAECVYLAPTPPDDRLIQAGADSASGPSDLLSAWTRTVQDTRQFNIRDITGEVVVWRRSGATATPDWLQSLETQVERALLATESQSGDGSGACSHEQRVWAVPVLSSHDRLFGYLGIEYAADGSRLSEDYRIVGLFGDLLGAYLERRIAEEAQHESEERWRKLVEGNPEPILITVDGRIIYVNAIGAALLGGSTDEHILGRSPYDFVYAQDYENIERKIEVNLDGGVIGPEEQTIIRLDGEERIVEWFSVPINHRGRKAAQIVLRDITHRKQAERALQESELRFRILADSAPVLIWMADSGGSCTYFNQGWLTFRGRPLDKEKGFGWFEGIHPEDREQALASYCANVESRTPFRAEYRLQRADGSYRWILDIGIPRTTPDGLFVGFIGSCIDLTELKQAMQALEASEERYRTFVETISEGIWRAEFARPVDTKTAVARPGRGVLAECNDAMLALLEDASAGKGHPVGKPLRALMPCLDPLLIREFIESGYQLRNREYTISRPDVRARHLVMNVVGTVENDALVRIWGSCIDVTDRVELEQQMVTALERQQQRFGRDLHDGVGQLLTAVRMLSSNLADRFFTEEEDGYILAKKVARFADDASQRVREIYSGLAPFQLYQDGLSIVLQDFAHTLNALPGVSCTYNHDGTTDVRGNETMLHLYRIVQEATNNALKYARSKTIRISLHKDKDLAVLEIRDDGEGFEVGSKHNSRSLGLRSMYYRARVIGGNLTIESRTERPETGTMIRCTFPLSGRVSHTQSLEPEGFMTR